MDNMVLIYFHLATAVASFCIGTYLLVRRKGSPAHRQLGKVYMLLMMVTAVSTLFIPAQVGPQVFYHFGYIHILSVVTLYTVPEAIFAIRKGDIKKHRNAMVILYVMALLVAGAFAFMPGRLLHTWFFV
ncbi:DUF2306 domain-containing protein [Enterovibrio sp. ZSDZ42]|uniref:DUF2306 domain-containing protein n=1 Tax=Enterovibrio gelatinilyticus TaxID=2899819 RepID=A0ABT5R4I2_9GAMM|nr:DUF2306 domain-containing protein [Enterovibrio sp. ZSDZ42]MDD1795188.1 DUF2306 domain-containing protein [Enterovibrio sp. ZSDZ42]